MALTHYNSLIKANPLLTAAQAGINTRSHVGICLHMKKWQALGGNRQLNSNHLRLLDIYDQEHKSLSHQKGLLNTNQYSIRVLQQKYQEALKRR